MTNKTLFKQSSKSSKSPDTCELLVISYESDCHHLYIVSIDAQVSLDVFLKFVVLKRLTRYCTLFVALNDLLGVLRVSSVMDCFTKVTWIIFYEKHCGRLQKPMPCIFVRSSSDIGSVLP